MVVCSFPYRQVIADVVSNAANSTLRECVMKLNILAIWDLKFLQSASSRSLCRSPPMPIKLKKTRTSTTATARTTRITLCISRASTMDGPTTPIVSLTNIACSSIIRTTAVLMSQDTIKAIKINRSANRDSSGQNTQYAPRSEANGNVATENHRERPSGWGQTTVCRIGSQAPALVPRNIATTSVETVAMKPHPVAGDQYKPS